MKKILVVEDSATNLYLIDYILTHAGYEVIRATTGEAGVEMALQRNPDLILMDIQLPGIDGLETTRRIRRTDAGKAIPIVALTAYAMAGDRERALAAGCTGYLEKPVNPETIVREIDAFLRPPQVEKP
jgi:two-component system cell cycle response regulator DivK